MGKGHKHNTNPLIAFDTGFRTAAAQYSGNLFAVGGRVCTSACPVRRAGAVATLQSAHNTMHRFLRVHPKLYIESKREIDISL